MTWALRLYWRLKLNRGGETRRPWLGPQSSTSWLAWPSERSRGCGAGVNPNSVGATVMRRLIMVGSTLCGMTTMVKADDLDRCLLNAMQTRDECLQQAHGRSDDVHWSDDQNSSHVKLCEAYYGRHRD